MITRGFKPVGWVAAVGAAALGCYMLSLQVAAERADLTSLERRIVETRQQIRSLQTELGTRGRLQQLEQWNDEVLALSAPGSGQFLASEAQLARFNSLPAALDNAPEVQMASAAPAPAPAPAAPAAAPAAQRAVATPQRSVAPPPALQQPLVQRASLDVPAQAAPAPARTQPAPPRTRTASTEPRAAAPTRTVQAAPAPTRTRTAAATPPPRRASLLDEHTMRDIGTVARAERRGGTRD